MPNTPSAVLMGYDDSVISGFPKLQTSAIDHPLVTAPRSAFRPTKQKAGLLKLHARRRNASTLGAGVWSRRFDEEPKYEDQNRQSVDEARAELRRIIDAGPMVPHGRRVRARRWYVPPGRPPD